MELRTKPLTLLRLRSMSLTEIAYRGRQEAVKAFERFAPAGRAADADGWARTHAPSLADPDVALQIVRELAPRRFFAGAAEASTAGLLRERFPEECERIVATADDALAGRFDLLGYRGLSFGVPIDWHLDPVWWKRAPMTHWSRLDPLDAAAVGDSKVVWELNRHQWLVRLAQAWVVTRDTRYASACIEQFYAWFEANPPGMGVNWTSSLEASYRLMSWSWMMLLIRDWPGLTSRCVRDVLVSVWQHAIFVRRHLSYYFSPNTHLTGEALGLVHAGVVFPFYREASDWRAVGLRVLLEECGRQVHADGVHFEQSTCYQRYSADTYLTLLTLAARNAVTLPREVSEQTARMVNVLAAMQRPDGTMPAIGDADGGHLLPITQRGPADSRGTCALGAAMFGRPDFAWAAGGAAPELLWLLGRDGLRRFEALRPQLPADGLRVFSSGYVVMRHRVAEGTHQLTADAGPLGCPASSGHGHADLLSVQLSIFGDPCLVDAGTGCYTPEPQWRDYFRGTAAHSTVRVDRLDQADPAGPFKWHQRPSARVRSWRSDATVDVLDASHDAYARLADPVMCRRRVIFVKPGYWLVVDDLHGEADHQIDVTFQFAPDVKIVSGPEPWILAETRGGHSLWMLPVASTRVETVICCGELDPPCGWVSSDYGQREPAPSVMFSAAATLPWRAMTLLVPVAGGADTPPALATLHDAQGRPTGVRFNAPLRSVHFTDESVTVE
jgi:hypothetical protein